MKIIFNDLGAQYSAYKAEIDRAMSAVLEHGQFIMGPEIRELESQLADYVGVRHCVSVGSGTMSLEIALRALGVGFGDEVITSSFSWISSAEVISLVGATPVFVDIDPLTFNMDHKLLESVVTERTKAIIPVSLFGQTPDLTAISQIAARFGIPVIEDGAQSFGAKWQDRKSCGSTLIGSTSFFPAKVLGCYGDGGALFTDDDELAEKMSAIRTHGGIKRNDHRYVGTNGRLDTLQAAILLAKLPHLDDEIRRRRDIAHRYAAILEPYVRTPIESDGAAHVFGQYTVRVPDRERVQRALTEVGVPFAVYYPRGIHEQPVYSGLGYREIDLPEVHRATREVLSLPIHPFMGDNEADFVASVILGAL
jgi:UDP-2-acetamido-2-deoxy-ribo-hexuluronate aminotransferase